MLLLIQVVFASLLVTGGTAVVALWLFGLALSFQGDTGLLPWTATAIPMFGPLFLVIAAVISGPGIVWANHLSARVPARWQRLMAVPGYIGTAALVFGLVGVVAAYVVLALWTPTASVTGWLWPLSGAQG
jgi:hypothetical protein